MKILYILDYFYPHIGGAEKMFFELCDELSKKGIEIKVATSRIDNKSIRLINKNFSIYYFDWKKIFGHPIIKQKDLMRFEKWPDIIHTATYTSAYFAYKFAKKINKKIILTVYEYLGRNWFMVEKNFIKSFLYYFFESYVVHKNYDFFHAISLHTKKQLVDYQIDKNKIKVIYPIFSQKKLLNSERINFNLKIPKNYFLYFGRPGKTKGIFFLYEAFKKFLEINKKFSLLYILSDYPKTEKLRLIELIKKDRLNDFLYVFNSLNEKELFFVIKKAYAVVIPSLTEGFGFTAYESSLMGKKLVVSNAGSLPEVVFGKVLFFKRNNVLDLVDKLNQAAKNQFGKINKNEDNFDYKKRISEMISLYQSIIIER